MTKFAEIRKKVLNGERLSFDDGVYLYSPEVDLNELGVPHVKYLRIRSVLSTGPGGGNSSADFKIFAVDTSPASAAQTLSFD